MKPYTHRIIRKKPVLVAALTLLTALVIFTSGAQAQDSLLPRESVGSVGMSANRLARFDALADEYVASGHIAGVVALVANHQLRDGDSPVRASDESPSWDGQGAYVRGHRRLFSGNGGLLSTAHDYARFLQMLLNDGELDGARIVSPASVRLMTVNHVGDLYAVWYPGMGFGFNVEVKLDPAAAGYEVPALASPGAYAWGGAGYTRFWVDPAQNLIGVFMTQTRPTTGDLHQKFGNIVYGAIISPAQ